LADAVIGILIVSATDLHKTGHCRIGKNIDDHKMNAFE